MESSKSEGRPLTRGLAAKKSKEKKDEERSRKMWEAGKIKGPNHVMVDPNKGNIKTEEDVDVKDVLERAPLAPTQNLTEAETSPEDFEEHENGKTLKVKQECDKGFSFKEEEGEVRNILLEEVDIPMDMDLYKDEVVNEATIASGATNDGNNYSSSSFCHEGEIEAVSSGNQKQNLNKGLNRKRRDPVDDSASLPQPKLKKLPKECESEQPTKETLKIEIPSNLEGNHFESSRDTETSVSNRLEIVSRPSLSLNDNHGGGDTWSSDEKLVDHFPKISVVEPDSTETRDKICSISSRNGVTAGCSFAPSSDMEDAPNAHVPQQQSRDPGEAVQNINDSSGKSKKSARLQKTKLKMLAEKSAPTTQLQTIGNRSNVKRKNLENYIILLTDTYASKAISLLDDEKVLTTIFERCSVKDLKNCRLVSRLWRDVSFSTWRSYGYATIHPDKTGRKLLDFQSFSINYHPHLAALGQIREVPFTNYKLLNEDSRWLYQVWGSYIKCLILETVQFSSQNAFLKTIFKHCQNLENLVLIQVQVTHAVEVTKGKLKAEIINWNKFQINKKLKSMCLDDFEWEGVAWMELLYRIPSLQALSLLNSVSHSEELFQSLRAIRKRNHNNLKIKTVSFQKQNISSAILSVLLDSTLDLEYIELSRANFLDLNISLPKIIENSAYSLKKLVVLSVVSDTAAINNFQLPKENQLENLQELNITYHSVRYPLASFLKVAPNLRKLIFMGTSASHLGIEDVSNVADIRLNYCSEMEIDVPFLSSQDLKLLIKWIPNLKKLRITGLNNNLFSIVCDGWANLVWLDAPNCSVDDSGLTGLDIEDVKIINRNGKGKRGDRRPITVPRPNITSLKGLRRLNLNAIPLDGNNQYRINYCTFAYGINQLANLKYLKIENFKLNGRNSTPWQSLFDRFKWPEDEK